MSLISPEDDISQNSTLADRQWLEMALKAGRASFFSSFSYIHISL
jgi:hypothetical protein